VILLVAGSVQRGELPAAHPDPVPVGDPVVDRRVVRVEPPGLDAERVS